MGKKDKPTKKMKKEEEPEEEPEDDESEEVSPPRACRLCHCPPGPTTPCWNPLNALCGISEEGTRDRGSWMPSARSDG